MKMNMVKSSLLALALATAGVSQAAVVASSDASVVMKEGASGGRGNGRGRPEADTFKEGASGGRGNGRGRP